MSDLQYAAPDGRTDMEPIATPMVETRELSRDYEMPGGVVHAVRDVSIRTPRCPSNRSIQRSRRNLSRAALRAPPIAS